MLLPSRHTLRPLAFAALVVAAVLVGGGCGYQNGPAGGAGFDPRSNGNAPDDRDTGYQWKSIYRQDVRTVAVPVFSNVAYQRGVEFALSKALVNQIEANTPYKVVPRERADTILEGRITSVGVNTLSENSRAGIPQEQLLDITVSFTWKDLRTGRILMSRQGLEQTASYYPTLGEGRFTGTQLAAERLATTIVQQMQSDW
jgi:hypothetical protein